MNKRVALVTGANRGIGFEVCRQLAQQDIHVIATARDAQKGQSAVEALRDGGGTFSFFQLDVSQEPQRKAAYDYVAGEFGQLDILVNNAAVFLDAEDASAPSESVFEAHFDKHWRTLETNVHGPWRLCQLFVPLMAMQDYGRVVNVSSRLGQLADMNGKAPAYRLSKVSLNALTRIMADELKDSNVLVNCMCPGWTRTGMGGEEATRDAAEAADTAVFLAMLPDGGPSGGFFRDRQPIPW